MFIKNLIRMKNNKQKILFIFLIHILTVNLTIYSENLIRNPGFEEENGSLPLYWSLFVQPQEGSYGKIDKKIFYSGKNSIFLNNSNPYPKEPMNNWSQKLSINASKNTEINFEGWMKTESVFKSYFLIQFWKQNPARIIDSKKTETLSGTNDWKRVKDKIKIPEETDFAVLRCVVEGKGSAWFDDVFLEYSGEQRDVIKENTEIIKNENKNIEDGIKNIEKKLENLLKENTQLKERIRSLEEENKKIKEELEKLNTSEEGKNGKENITGKQINEEKNIEDNQKVPILVPHKKNWQIIKREQK